MILGEKIDQTNILCKSAEFGIRYTTILFIGAVTLFLAPLAQTNIVLNLHKTSQ